ncbi:MAG: InlB B-repeat-containing protein [Bacteroidaceae bacterium]|nr:InlB B-repeat-containing protein [Bacteroidaceae bacterium]
MISFSGNKAKAFACINGKNVKLKKGYIYENGAFRKLYSAGNIVTYIIDVGVQPVTAEVDEGTSCLATSFKPTKNGWDFVGWRKDGAATGSVETNVIMGDAPITLYAVYQQKVTLSYNGNSATSGSTSSQSNYRYYNAAGNVLDANFVLKQSGFAKTNYTFSGWDIGAAGSYVTLSENTVAYAQWVGVPYTWVNNWVGSGAPLSINVTTDKWHEDLQSYTYTTNRFQFNSESPDEQSESYCTFSTNAVDTRGLKKMTICFSPNGDGGFYPGTSGGEFKVISNTGEILYSVTNHIMSTVIIDVSRANSIYIAGHCGCWAYHGNAYVNVYSISFGN